MPSYKSYLDMYLGCKFQCAWKIQGIQFHYFGLQIVRISSLFFALFRKFSSILQYSMRSIDNQLLQIKHWSIIVGNFSYRYCYSCMHPYKTYLGSRFQRKKYSLHQALYIFLLQFRALDYHTFEIWVFGSTDYFDKSHNLQQTASYPKRRQL